MKNTFLSSHPKIQVLVKSLLFIFLFIALLCSSGFLQMMFPPIHTRLMYGILGCIGGMITVWIFLKIGKLSFKSIGLGWERKTLVRFVYGLLMGAVIFAIIIFPLLGFSALKIHYNASFWQWSSLMFYLPLLPLALMEEIGFRSYPQFKLKKAFGLWGSQIIVAVAFGAYHILNGWSVYTSFTGPLVWGVVFGLAAIWSRGIAMPTGIHLALNILQNMVGLKGKGVSLWKLDYPPGTSQIMMDKTDHIGLALQMAVLALALATTWWYAKCKPQPMPL